MKYQIVYTKSFPLTTLASTEADAKAIAARLEKAGYIVGIYQRTEAGSRKIA